MTKDDVTKALRQAYNLGQIYWQQADSEYMSQHKKADQTEAKFQELLETTSAALEAKDEPVCDKDPQGCWSVRCQLGNQCKNTPPQRTWVGLTDKDWKRSKHTEDFEKGVDWAEAMLKAKNT